MITSLLMLSTLWRAHAFVTKSVLPATRVIDLVPSLITPGPQVDDQAIFARGNLATCAYVSGNAASPLTCPSAYSCTMTQKFFLAWGCCDQIQCKGLYFTCVDYGAQLCPGLDNSVCSQIYTSILSCSSDAPSCFSYARSKSVGDPDVIYSLGCGQSAGSILALITPVTGQEKGGKITTTSGGNTSPSAGTDVVQSTDNSDATPSSASDNNPPSSASSSNSSGGSSQNSKSLSKGEIAAIVIPCVGTIIAIILAWWKRHQVVWFFTCGAYGYKYSKKPSRVFDDGGPHAIGNPLVPMPTRGPMGYNAPPPPPQMYHPINHTQQSFHSFGPAQQGYYR